MHNSVVNPHNLVLILIVLEHVVKEIIDLELTYYFFFNKIIYLQLLLGHNDQHLTLFQLHQQYF